MFNQEQVAALEADLSRSHVSERSNGGMTLSYIEGYHAINTANRIFGFDAWSHDIVELKKVCETNVNIGFKKEPGIEVVYMATVKITVGDQIHVDVGSGNGRAKSPKDAHELAMKEAVTDAMKRALRHWGNQFGNCLYDKKQTNVTDDAPEEKPTKTKAKKETKEAINIEKLMATLRACTDTEEVEKFRQEYRDLIPSDKKSEFLNVYKEVKNKFRKEK